MFGGKICMVSAPAALVAIVMAIAPVSCSDSEIPPYIPGKPYPPPTATKPDAAAARDAVVGDGAALDGAALDASIGEASLPDAAPGDATSTDALKSCTVDCDCIQGETCVFLKCRMESLPTYCCTRPGCPTGQFCTDSTGLGSTCP